MIKKIFRFFRLSVLIVAFVFLLLPFMFFSVVNKGVKKVKNILGFQSKDSADNDIFSSDNQAWADVPSGTEPEPPRCINFSFKDRKGTFNKFSQVIPRTKESSDLISLPKEAVSSGGELILNLKWTRTHRLVSLGIIERGGEIGGASDFEEMEPAESYLNRKREDCSKILKNRNAEYLHTVQGDEVGLVFKSKTGEELKLKISERDPEESFMDQLKVYRVEHGADEEIIIGDRLSNFYILKSRKMQEAKPPKEVLLNGKAVSLKKGINLHYGQNISVKFGGLNLQKSYSLIAKTENRGWSPTAQTVFQAVPKPLRFAIKFAFFGAIGLATRKFWNDAGLSLPFFALMGGQSTPYLAVWNGKDYVTENDIMFSPTLNYDPDLSVAKNRYESGACAPDLYVIKNYRKHLPGGRVASYVVSASGFYTDLRIQNRKIFKNLAWLIKKTIKS